MLTAQHIRQIILEQSKRAHVGHIGSCLCVADILAVLYNDIFNISSPDNPQRDRFILSKGHAALALYAVLYLKGWIDRRTLDGFYTDDSLLGVHPEHQLTGIDFSTGSLGQGLSFATGAALAGKLQDASRRIYVLLSDAELNEGATWEAIMFAAHHQLGNLTLIIDLNDQQALNYTSKVIDLSVVTEKLINFGWDTSLVDGHDMDALKNALSLTHRAPTAIVAQTIFGKGISYMEKKIKWHYMPMSDEEYAQAIQEIMAD